MALAKFIKISGEKESMAMISIRENAFQIRPKVVFARLDGVLGALSCTKEELEKGMEFSIPSNLPTSEVVDSTTGEVVTFSDGTPMLQLS